MCVCVCVCVERDTHTYTERYRERKKNTKLCIEREKSRSDPHEAPKDIYKKGEEGWPVPGMVVPYEEPLDPEMVIDTERTSIEDAVEKIKREIERFNS